MTSGPGSAEPSILSPHRGNGHAASLPWIALIAGAVLLSLSFQGTRGLLDPDEGRYVECAREMLETGEYLTPMLGSQPHFTKPPVCYWLIAQSIALGGRHEWAARLPNALAYGTCILVVGLLGSTIWNRRTGLLAGAVYATSLTPFIAGNIVTPDTLLTLWEALALLAFWKALRTGTAGPRGGWLFLTGAAFGLAFLTKGPPGLLFLPSLIGACLASSAGAGKSSRRILLHPSGYLAFGVLGISWYLIEGARVDGLLSYLVREEVFGRLAGEHHRNSEWYGALIVYLPTLTLGALPWSATWPPLLKRWFRARGAGSIFRSLGGSPEAMFLVLAIGFSLVALSVSRSRLPLYVLPLFVPLALVTARGLQMPEGPRPRRRPLVALGASWVALLLVTRLAFALWPGDWDSRALYRSLPLREVDEIVVADRRQHYGLAFYWKRPIRFCSVLPAAPGAVRSPSMEDEFRRQANGGGTVLYLVRGREMQRAEEKAAGAGLRVRETRKIGGLGALVCGPPEAGPGR